MRPASRHDAGSGGPHYANYSLGRVWFARSSGDWPEPVAIENDYQRISFSLEETAPE